MNFKDDPNYLEKLRRIVATSTAIETGQPVEEIMAQLKQSQEKEVVDDNNSL